MDGYDIFVAIHSLTRWLIVLVTLAGLGRFLWGWLGKQAWTHNDRILGSLFIGTMGLQLILGFIMLAWSFVDYGFVRLYWEHMFVMVIAFGVAHLLFRWRKLDNEQLRFRNSFFTLLVSFLLVVVGIITVAGTAKLFTL